MSYVINNNIATIRFTNGGQVYLLNKKAVREISVVRDDVIKISLGNCSSSIFIRHQDVSLPITQTAGILIDLMNVWISDYSVPDPPNE